MSIMDRLRTVAGTVTAPIKLSPARRLSHTADLLHPGLRMMFGRCGLSYEIKIDQESLSLMITAWRPGVAPLGFLVTWEEILDDVFPEAVVKNGRKLCNDLMAIPAGRAA